MAEDNYVHKTLVIATVFPCFATLAVIGRFVARRMKRLKLWWDDWTALLALVWLWCFCGLLIGSLKYGNGRHVEEVSPEDQVRTKMFTFLYQLFYTVDPTTVKISALLLYKRIFITQKFSIFINFMLALMVAWGIASTLVAIFSCTPVSGFWTGEGHCVLWHSWIVGYAIPNIIFDWVVWLMPLPRIWMMQLPPHQKIALTIVFTIGLVDCIVAIVRIATVAQSLGDPDSTYSWIPAQWWTLIHPTLGIITICLPTMRIFATKFMNLFRDPPEQEQSKSSAQSRWPALSRYNELRAMGISLSGDTDQNLHSNTIAMALRQDSLATTMAEGEIRVTSDFRVASSHKNQEAGIETIAVSPGGGGASRSSNTDTSRSRGSDDHAMSTHHNDAKR